jgi:hypothetical protein
MARKCPKNRKGTQKVAFDGRQSAADDNVYDNMLLELAETENKQPRKPRPSALATCYVSDSWAWEQNTADWRTPRCSGENEDPSAELKQLSAVPSTSWPATTLVLRWKSNKLMARLRNQPH